MITKSVKWALPGLGQNPDNHLPITNFKEDNLL